MAKPKIFISHIFEEKDIAIRLKEFIDTKFLNGLDVFVSSDEESIRLGDEWINNIKNSLKECELLIVLCSPSSISRAWINFESGAGWIRNIPVVPLCHSGLVPGDLPTHLKILQGALLNRKNVIEGLFRRIADLKEMSPPFISDDDFKNLFKDIVFGTSANGVIFIGANGFVVNGVAKVVDVPPFVHNGHVLVPVRMASEIIGASRIAWDEENKQIQFETSRFIIEFRIGTKTIKYNGHPHEGKVPPNITKGRTFVPIEDLLKLCSIKYEEFFNIDGTLDGIAFTSSDS